MTTAPVGASIPDLPEDAKKKAGDFVYKNTGYTPYSKDGVTLYRVVRNPA